MVAWATEALDAERRRAWNDARALGAATNGPAARPEHRAASRRGPQAQGRPLCAVEEPRRPHRTPDAKLAWIAKTDTRLYRAYLLKEGLRHVFSVKGEEGKQALDRWISWARRCRIPVFVELAAASCDTAPAIDAALDHGLSQGLIESTNTKIRLLTRIAFGFRSPKPSSPWPCSPSAATAPPCPADKHPRISSQSQKYAR